MPAASAEMVTRSVSEMRPSSTASRVRRMVISFVTEATARGASAFSSKRIWPLWGSRSSAAAQFSVIGGASSSGAPDSAGAGRGVAVGSGADRSSSVAAAVRGSVHASSRHSRIRRMRMRIPSIPGSGSRFIMCMEGDG